MVGPDRCDHTSFESSPRYEKRVVDIVLETKNLPETLAENGTVDISTVDIAKLIGKVGGLEHVG